MTEKTDAIFAIALLILTIVGLAISSVAHAEEPCSLATYLR